MSPTDGLVTLSAIQDALRRLGGWGSVYIPEFTHGRLRIDALVVDVKTRWARGFEIKMNRGDFLRDQKWHEYSAFCSSLSIVCPANMIQKPEIPDPFGLLWIRPAGRATSETFQWVKKPKRFQRRDSMAWLWTYVGILERELPRLVMENKQLRNEFNRIVLEGAAKA